MLLSTAPNHGPKASLLEFGFINPCYDMVHTQHLIGRSNQIKVIVIYLNWWRIKLLICVICELWICGYGWWWLSYTNVMQYFLNYILSLGWWVQYKIFWNQICWCLIIFANKSLQYERKTFKVLMHLKKMLMFCRANFTRLTCTF